MNASFLLFFIYLFFIFTDQISIHFDNFYVFLRFSMYLSANIWVYFSAFQSLSVHSDDNELQSDDNNDPVA